MNNNYYWSWRLNYLISHNLLLIVTLNYFKFNISILSLNFLWLIKLCIINKLANNLGHRVSRKDEHVSLLIEDSLCSSCYCFSWQNTIVSFLMESGPINVRKLHPTCYHNTGVAREVETLLEELICQQNVDFVNR